MSAANQRFEVVIRSESKLACRSWESESAEEREGLERNCAAEGKEASEVAGRNQVQFTSERGGGHNCAYRLRSNVNLTLGPTRIRSTVFCSTLF